MCTVFTTAHGAARIILASELPCHMNHDTACGDGAKNKSEKKGIVNQVRSGWPGVCWRCGGSQQRSHGHQVNATL